MGMYRVYPFTFRIFVIVIFCICVPPLSVLRRVHVCCSVVKLPGDTYYYSILIKSEILHCLLWTFSFLFLLLHRPPSKYAIILGRQVHLLL